LSLNYIFFFLNIERINDPVFNLEIAKVMI
jgi:hypothetical protein